MLQVPGTSVSTTSMHTSPQPTNSTPDKYKSSTESTVIHAARIDCPPKLPKQIHLAAKRILLPLKTHTRMPSWTRSWKTSSHRQSSQWAAGGVPTPRALPLFQQ
ncbi:hypothetical protein ABW21_db0209353 [Orbilia brochopaga]|nr:hypothetical protein ABW21_db0209353 [Drechslerella brochopaga]